MIRRLFIFMLILTLSVSLSCSNSEKEKTTRFDKAFSPKIKSNQEKAYKILEKLIVAEKRFAVKNGYYTEIKELREKDFFNIDDTNITRSGYKIRIKHDGVKELAIYMNPVAYKVTGMLSYFADQTSKIRGGDHKGQDASTDDPVI